jgi:hypothetical protein
LTTATVGHVLAIGVKHAPFARSSASLCYNGRMTDQTMRSKYLALRSPYEPDNIRLVIVAESPPAGGKYFYNPEGARSEPLFAAMMKQLGLSPTTKEDGLRKFQQCGWVLVDATYEPINKMKPGSKRDGMIDRAYPLLHDDLARLMTPDRLTPLVLIKENVCRILKPKLIQDRFRVLNGGIVIPFPSHGHQPEFHEKFGLIIKSAGI